MMSIKLDYDFVDKYGKLDFYSYENAKDKQKELDIDFLSSEISFFEQNVKLTMQGCFSIKEWFAMAKEYFH